MRQLGELKKSEDKFKELGVEIIAIFREDEKGVEGLEIIKEKAKVGFTLAFDKGKKQTGSYSPGRREFSNYVIGPDGKVAAIIEGDLRNRAKSKQLFEELEKLTKKKKSSKKDK